MVDLCPSPLVGRPFRPLQLTVQVTTDGSPIDWDVHCSAHEIHALWSDAERLLHISDLEMFAVIKAFCTFRSLVVGRGVQIATDNMATLY